MAAKKEETSVVNVVDVFWDSWFNSFKTFQSIQTGVEEKSFQAFANQKEWIKTTNDQLLKLEEESKKWASDWKSYLEDSLKKTQKEFGGQNITEWTEKVEEIGDKAQTLIFKPGKDSLEVLTNSQAQLEKTIKNALDQQQKNREDVMNALDSFVEQVKQTQNGLLKSFQTYNPFITSK